jgi:hypothetical protein
MLMLERRLQIVHPLDVRIECRKAGDAEVLRQLSGQIHLASGSEVDAAELTLRNSILVQVRPRHALRDQRERIEAIREAGRHGLFVPADAEIPRGLLVAEQIVDEAPPRGAKLVQVGTSIGPKLRVEVTKVRAGRLFGDTRREAYSQRAP